MSYFICCRPLEWFRNFGNVQQVTVLQKTLIIKHAERKSEFICLWVFHSITVFFYDSALMHPVTFTSGLLHWTRVTLSDIHVPPRKIWVDACSPKTKVSSRTPSLFACVHRSRAWFMEAIRSTGCKKSSKPQHKLFCLLSGCGWNIISKA